MPPNRLRTLHQSYLQNHLPLVRLPPYASLVLLVPTFTDQIGASWGKELIWGDKQGQLLLPVYVTTPKILQTHPITFAGVGLGGGLFEKHLVLLV